VISLIEVSAYVGSVRRFSFVSRSGREKTLIHTGRNEITHVFERFAKLACANQRRTRRIQNDTYGLALLIAARFLTAICSTVVSAYVGEAIQLNIVSRNGRGKMLKKSGP